MPLATLAEGTHSTRIPEGLQLGRTLGEIQLLGNDLSEVGELCISKCILQWLLLLCNCTHQRPRLCKAQLFGLHA